MSEETRDQLMASDTASDLTEPMTDEVDLKSDQQQPIEGSASLPINDPVDPFCDQLSLTSQEMDVVQENEDEKSVQLADYEVVVDYEEEAETSYFQPDPLQVLAMMAMVDRPDRPAKIMDGISTSKKLDGMDPKKLVDYQKRLAKLLATERERNAELTHQLSGVKLHQWCSVCLFPATMNCCWNVSYCGVRCQHKHWRKHRETCQRVDRSGEEAKKSD